MKKTMFGLLMTLSAVTLVACSEEEMAVGNSTAEEVAEATNGKEIEAVGEEVTPVTSDIELTHVHGLGYSADGAGLYIPSHDGLKVFDGNEWRAADIDPHDYMGFSMVDDGFYSSGHPAPGSKLANPFGIVRSTDMGQTLEMLDLYKEIDFHLMDVGYYSHAIYVLNPQPNSEMDDTGIYYSADAADTWMKSAAEGLTGEQVMAIAVHPRDEATVAVATEQGVFLSEDYGQMFEMISEVPTTAVAFSPEGTLLAGGVAEPFVLTSFNLETDEQTPLSIPELTGQNAISYVAVSPQNEQRVTFTTFEKDVFLSEDGGNSWIQIAEKGTGLALSE